MDLARLRVSMYVDIFSAGQGLWMVANLPNGFFSFRAFDSFSRFSLFTKMEGCIASFLLSRVSHLPAWAGTGVPAESDGLRPIIRCSFSPRGVRTTRFWPGPLKNLSCLLSEDSFT